MHRGGGGGGALTSIDPVREVSEVFARNVKFFFIVSGSERSYIFHVLLNALLTLTTLVQDVIKREFLNIVFICYNCRKQIKMTNVLEYKHRTKQKP